MDIFTGFRLIPRGATSLICLGVLKKGWHLRGWVSPNKIKQDQTRPKQKQTKTKKTKETIIHLSDKHSRAFQRASNFPWGSGSFLEGCLERMEMEGTLPPIDMEDDVWGGGRPTKDMLGTSHFLSGKAQRKNKTLEICFDGPSPLEKQPRNMEARHSDMSVPHGPR